MLKERMNCKYLFAILFLSRLFVSFTYIGSTWSDVAVGDKPLVVVCWLLFSLLAFLPTVFYLRSDLNTSVLEEARSLSPTLARGLALLYALTCFFVCFDSGMRFELFASSVMFPDTPMLLFLIALFACAGYGAYRGLRAIGRTAVILAVVVGAALLFLAVALIGRIELDNLTPPLYNGAAPVLKTGLYSLTMTPELAVVPLLLSDLKGDLIKGFFRWIACLFAAIFLLVFLTAAVLGEFGNTRLFPIYSVTVRAALGVFQRLDALQTGLWTLCVLLKLCFFMRLSCYSLEQVFPLKKKGMFFVGLIAVLTVSVTIFDARLNSVLAVFRSGLYAVLFFLTAVVVPVGIPLLKKVKNGRSVRLREDGGKE